MNELWTFIATFGLVFALAFQSLNTNRGHYKAAFFTSFLIGSFQLYVLKAMPFADSLSMHIAYLSGGPFGAVAAMWAHARWMKKRH